MLTFFFFFNNDRFLIKKATKNQKRNDRFLLVRFLKTIVFYKTRRFVNEERKPT